MRFNECTHPTLKSTHCHGISRGCPATLGPSAVNFQKVCLCVCSAITIRQGCCSSDRIYLVSWQLLGVIAHFKNTDRCTCSVHLLIERDAPRNPHNSLITLENHAISAGWVYYTSKQATPTSTHR